MSKVTIQGDASGTGIFTIASPNSNTNRTLTLPDEAGTVDTLQRAGNVLQVVSTTKTNTFSTAATSSWVEVTGLNVTVTPSATSSKVLITGLISVGNSIATAAMYMKVQRNGVDICIGDANGSNQRVMAQTDTREYSQRALPIAFLDSPSTTSSCQYKVYILSLSATMYVNRDGEGGTANSHGIGTSTITVMEIAA